MIKANGKVYGPYQMVDKLKTSPDHSIAVWIEYREGSTFLYINGKKHGPYDKVTEIKVLKDVYFIAKTKSGYGLYKNGKLLETHSYIYGLTFSPSGKNIAYVIKENGKEYVVLNGKKGKPYTEIKSTYGVIGGKKASLSFSPDEKHLFYIAYSGNNPVFVVNGKEIATLYSTKRVKLRFSEDGKNYIVALQTGKSEYSIFVNGKLVKKLNSKPSSIAVADDGTYAYAIREGKDVTVYKNGKKVGVYPGLWQLEFSRSGNLFYLAGFVEKGKITWKICADGEVYDKSYGIITTLKGPFILTGDRSIRLLARRGNTLYRVDVKI